MATKIEIDLADLGWTYDPDGEPAGETTLQDLVVREVSRMVLTSEFRREVQSKVEQIIDDEATEQVREVVRDVVNGPIQRMTSWGEKKGEPTSVREIVRERVEAFMKTQRRDSYSPNRGNTLTDIIDEATRHILTGELAETVKQAKAEVHTKVTKAAIDAAVQVLSR